MIRYALIAALACAAPAAAQTQTALNQQAGAAWKAADATMTAQWQRTYAAMKRRDAADTSRGGGFGYAAATLASQRAWLAFRDAQCVIEGGEYAGGSMQPMVQRQCLARLTRERTAQLKDLMWQRGR
ncbi:lysozyme inhibitor LprI family protein [Sphingomonas sp. CLY1604]|uniref:lysozyme inhibitor LprI family protein n=1 Tax=Sphingomonas sp. CLY1604 TaxID=3457786 RepID=UPI003FD75EB7